MSDAARALTEQFMLWVLEKPRSYREVMDAWRTTCPQLTIWEDAVGAGLFVVKPRKSLPDATVVITDRGLIELADNQNAIS